MTTAPGTLTDRYVWAVTRNVPDAQRADLDRELRERIGDSIDALVETGRAPADAERMALTELGDPGALAASYVDRPLQLIGPRYYLTWWRLIKLLYSVVLPIAVAAVAFGQVLGQEPVGQIIGTTITAAIAIAVHLGFWTTLVFAVLDRNPRADAELPWAIDMLPLVPPPARLSRRADLIASLVFLGIFAALIVWQQFGVPYVPGLEGVPFLNPDLWSFWLPYFLGLIALEILFAIAIYRWGWNPWLAGTNLLLNLAFAVPAIWLFTTGQLVSPEAIAAMGWPWDADSEWVVTAVVVVTIAGVAVWDVIDGVIKTVRGRGGSVLALGHI
ncbi:hypothetical protein ET445_16230 [Agromyces protaetiae]|uniref:Uncharacterized protein n=1 Tax=Agromyces protaetiae TaxID=2509455 RepID=A0A4P6FKW4_9MICO|nr:permease prefix domain 1-containing protein [Agromyces protaetiae]QAY74647.1 hypothetical protein ET445_16230 [Agromyces protaetiae]